MGKVSVTPAFRKDDIDKDFGRLVIRITKNRKSEIIYTGKKLSLSEWEENWSKDFKQFKPTYDKAKEFNKCIEDILAELKENQNDKNQWRKSKESFLSFWENELKTFKVSTATKYSTVLKSFTIFLNLNKKKDLKFSDLNKEIFTGYAKFLLEREIETYTHYLDVLKIFMNRASEKGFYLFNTKTLKLHERKVPQQTSIQALSERELNQIVAHPTLRFSEIKKKFLFQIFCNGMRLSDLALLRWGKLSGGFVKYKMLKTEHTMNIEITPILGLLLFSFLPKDGLDSDYSLLFTNTSKLIEEGKNGEIIHSNIIKLINRIARLQTNGLVFNILDSKIFEGLYETKYPLMSKKQLSEMKRATKEYNKELAGFMKETGLNPEIRSHVARHTAAEQVMQISTDPINVSIYLGHSTIQGSLPYIKAFHSATFNASVSNTLNLKFNKKFKDIDSNPEDVELFSLKAV